MIVEDKTVKPGTAVFLQEERCRKAADAAADYDAIEDFAGVDGFRRQRVIEQAAANLVTGGHHFERVSVGIGVIADAAVAGPVVVAGIAVLGIGQQLLRSDWRQQRAAGGQES